MKKLLISLCIFILSSPLLSQSNADLGVAAIGLVVSDIEQSEDFYTNIIGMREVGGFSLDKQWSMEAGAANDQPFSVKQFKLVDAPTSTILKLAYFDHTDKVAETSGIDKRPGVNYITLFYNKSGFNEVIDRVNKAGIKKIGWVKRDSYQLVFVRDPDGVFVELVGPPEN